VNEYLFNYWNFLKKKINSISNNDLFFKERDVRIATLGINIGTEQNGDDKFFNRPVLILKKINKDSLVVLPLSSVQKNSDFYYNFTNPFDKNVSIIIAQVKFISSKRLKRKLYRLDKIEFQKVKNRFAKVILNIKIEMP